MSLVSPWESSESVRSKMLVPLAEGGWGTRRGLDDEVEAPPTTPTVAMAMVAGVVNPFLGVFANRDMKAFLKEESRTPQNTRSKVIKP